MSIVRVELPEPDPPPGGVDRGLGENENGVPPGKPERSNEYDVPFAPESATVNVAALP